GRAAARGPRGRRRRQAPGRRGRRPRPRRRPLLRRRSPGRRLGIPGGAGGHRRLPRQAPAGLAHAMSASGPSAADRLPASLLIANRGEIALRVVRTCRALGIRPLAVHSAADAAAPHVRACDAAVALAGPTPAAGYLDGAQLIAAARRLGAEAIHPGYGFLSENAGFAEACAAAGLIFVGPSAAAIRAMGDKIAARRLAAAAGLPVVPGVEEGEGD